MESIIHSRARRVPGIWVCLTLFVSSGGFPLFAASLSPSQATELQGRLDAAVARKDGVAVERILLEMADRGGNDDLVPLAFLYSHGHPELGIQPDSEKFVMVFTRLADRGHAGAQSVLADHLTNADDSGPAASRADRRVSAYQWRLLAQIGAGYQDKELSSLRRDLTAEQLDAAAARAEKRMPAMLQRYGTEAYFRAGLLYLNGEHLPRNAKRALAHLEKAARDGNMYAQYRLGEALSSGSPDIKLDAPRALQWYRAAAAQNNRYALHRLGEFSLQGKHVVQDAPSAAGYFTKAAAAGHAESQVALGEMHMNGTGVAKDPAKAVEYFRSAAAQQHSQAWLYLGHAHRQGLGAERDIVEAYDWYRKAADAGLAEAQFTMGNASSRGVAVLFPRDFRKAAEWYEKAAAQGHGPARYNLGELYINGGYGLERDLARAYALIRTAGVSLDNTDAVLAGLLAQMSAEESARARALANESAQGKK